ncbi:MAG: MmgE/PrpD family protein [Ramlibacter sp.]|uniref:MmgE/PrpD family protein n=1 Tax=Ramlibacter sp. TaxID=1917967 RepID=UPI0026196B3D|nr:MmgE/PrpD family protein [Ramlibacter sp.]MDH4376742.1 MmgE/PrpD family protein [Ramlibacter sp.]
MIDPIGKSVHSIRWDAFSDKAQKKLLLCLLANLAVGIAGRSAMRMPQPAAGAGHLLLDGGQTPSARDAAFYNAALMHARTQDDFHPIGNLHLATVILPALLAQAESSPEISGRDFLEAMATGYACATGLSAQFSPLGTPRGLRSTSLYSAMGAAAAVARLRGQDAAGIANTIALASQSAFGTTQCWRDGSDEYQLHVGNGASQAILCAQLTDAGVHGGTHALDGPSGFYPALLGQVPAFDTIAADFDAEASILKTVLKRYPVSGICQPVVLLSERLAAALGTQRVQSVRVEMNAFEMNYPGTLNAGPVYKSFSDRLMSARFCVSSVLENGHFDFAAFVRPLSAEGSRIIAATDVQSADDLGTLSCRIRITTTEGQTIQGELRDGGDQLTIDWSSIDEWCAQLWKEAGRLPRYGQALRSAVEDLPKTGFAPLRQALLGSGAPA